MHSLDHEARVQSALEALGIPFALIARLQLPSFPEARELAVVEIGQDGFAHRLVPAAAAAWLELKRAAQRDRTVLEIVSAFRDLESQSEIIRAKIERGMPFETIFTLSAPPGYSEHHTGRAVDVNTPGCEAREPPFEHTDAFRWLDKNARQFGFTLSYPRGNASGFIYEPWHWYFNG